MSSISSNARDVAVSALRDRSGNVSARLDRLLSEAAMGPSDKALARELALGALRRKGTLRAVLRAFLARPQQRLPVPLMQVLYVALYQILFLQRVPVFAAVDEAVKQVVRFRHRRHTGLINGLLRSVARCVSETVTAVPPLRPDVVPVAPRAFRSFDRAVFPDPSSQSASYLAAAFSLPSALAGRWVERFGLQAAAEIAMHANVRAPLILRVNRLRCDVQGAVAALAGGGVGARPHANGSSIVLDEHVDVTELPAFRAGLVQPQDASATGVVLAAGAEPGMSVLDLCAAPGTKTTHLVECMANQGAIVAVDVSAEKLERIESNCRRMGASIVQTFPAEKVGSLEPNSFDLVLADVPCTNTGVLARRAEARWRFNEPALKRLVTDQRFLIAAAARFVAPGGRLVYSTCSIEPEECSGVAQRLLRRDRRLAIQREELTLPGGADEPTRWHDGGYVAIFQVR